MTNPPQLARDFTPIPRLVMAVAVNSVERRERLDVATDAIELEPLFGERARPGGSHFWGGLPNYKKNNVTAFPACDSRVRKCIFFARFKECAMRKRQPKIPVCEGSWNAYWRASFPQLSRNDAYDAPNKVCSRA